MPITMISLTEDLLELLSLYGGEFTEEGLFLNEDSNQHYIMAGQLSLWRVFQINVQINRQMDHDPIMRRSLF